MNKKLIIIVLVVGAVAVAGCVGGGDQAPDTGDGGGDGEGADDGTDGETDNGDGDGEGSGDADSDGDDSDGGDSDGTTGGTSDGDGDTDGSGTGDGTGGGTDGTNTLGNAFAMTEEFAFDAELRGEQQGTMTGRFSQGNMYLQFESDEGTFEFYIVGDNQYMVMSGQGQEFCIRNPDRSLPEESQIDPDDYESEVSEYSDLTPTGTTTIDGERVHVYELTPEMTGQSETVTYYVSIDTGHPRRVESADAVVDFHSWNNVDSIEAPDMNCQESPAQPGGSMPSGNY